MIKRAIIILIMLIFSCSSSDKEFVPTGPTGSSSGTGNLGGATRVYAPGVKGTLVAQPETVTGGGVITITVNDEDEAGTGGLIVTIASSRASITKRLTERGNGLFQGIIEVGGDPSKTTTSYQFLIVNTQDGDTVVITYLDNRNDKGEQEIATKSVTVAVTKPDINPDTVTVPGGNTQVFTVSGGTPPYTWSASGGVPLAGSGPVFNWTAPGVAGTYFVTVTDNNNFSSTATITVP